MTGGLFDGAAAIAAGTGATAGATLGASSMQAALAPMVRQRNAELSILSMTARNGGNITENARLAGYQIGNASETISFGGKSIAAIAEIKAGIYTGRDIISAPQYARTEASLASGLLASGEDPARASRGAEALGFKYFMGAPDIAEMARPVIGARSRYNRNDADLLLNFGPEAFGAYLDAYGRPDITHAQRGSFGNVQIGDYLAEKGSYQARGSGNAMAVARVGQMADILNLPEGRDSLAYARAGSQARDAMLLGFHQSDLTSFAIPGAQIQGRIDRANILPYNPSNLFALYGAQIGQNNQQIRTLSGRLETLARAGNLSEDEQYSLTSRIESLKTQNLADVFNVTEGRENLIPGLSAGRRRTVGAWTSDMALALSFANNNVPYRYAGATNGKQRRMQENFAEALGYGEGDLDPISRTGGINNLSGSGGGGAGTTNSLLSAILATLQGGGGQGQRPNGGVGQGFGTLGQRDVGRGNVTNPDAGAN
jgi:hypothetical protein